MTMATRQFRFGGLDNQHDPQTVGADGCIVAVNIDHADDRSVRRRAGYVATAATGIALHSLWGSEDQTYGYVVDGATLSYLASDLVRTTVGTLPSSSPVRFVSTGDTVAVITDSGCRYVQAAVFVIPTSPATLDEETSFTGAMSSIAGTCGAYFNGRLYVANGTSLIFSRPGNIFYYDTRDYLITIDFPVVTLFATDDGLWVCGATKSIFLQGASPTEFTYINKGTFGVFSGAKINPLDWGLQTTAKSFAVMTTKGVYILTSGGQFVDFGKGAYHPPSGIDHTSVVRKGNGFTQLLTSFIYSSESDPYTNKVVTVDHLET